MTGETRIWLHDAPPGLIGHALAVATPQDTFDNHWNVGAIVDVGIDNHPTEGPKGFIDVLDPDELIASALAENECGFVVYDHHDTNIGASAHHTFGAWTDAPAHDSGFTTFTDGAAGGAIKDFMVGWLLVPDVHQLAYLEIVAVADGEITVKGNAENMAAEGTQYWLIAPAGVSATTGATETNPQKMPNPWLWAGYHYMPPIAGFADPEGQDPGVYGKQPGSNMAGQYDCWNRRYEPQTGRWTTPDPAMSPWSNLFDYGDTLPIAFADPSGLNLLPSDAELVKGYWVDPGGVYGTGTCRNLNQAIRHLKMDIKRSDKSAGKGARGKEALSVLEKLYNNQACAQYEESWKSDDWNLTNSERPVSTSASGSEPAGCSAAAGAGTLAPAGGFAGAAGAKAVAGSTAGAAVTGGATITAAYVWGVYSWHHSWGEEARGRRARVVSRISLRAWKEIRKGAGEKCLDKLAKCVKFWYHRADDWEGASVAFCSGCFTTCMSTGVWPMANGCEWGQ